MRVRIQILKSGLYQVDGQPTYLEVGDQIDVDLALLPPEENDILAYQWQQHLDILAQPTRCNVCGKLEPECEFNERFSS